MLDRDADMGYLSSPPGGAMRERILEYISKLTRPLRKRELAKKMGISHEEYPKFRRVLKELVQEGKVARLRGGKYGPMDEANRIVGRLHVHPDGFGFVSREPEGPDIFVRSEDMGPALHGDKVVVQVYKRRRGTKPEGKVLQVVERAVRQLVGVYRSGTVLPDDPRFPVVYVSGDGAREGQKVVVEVEGGSVHALEGRITEVLGYPEEPGIDVASIIKEFELPEEFPPEVLREAESLPEEVPPEEVLGREDLRDLPAVTVDPEDAKDFDDAVSLEALGDGVYRLGVHIADVSYYVREGGEMDREAYRRGTSVYLVDRAIPMLPPRVSGDLCTLLPGEDRLTLSVLFDITEDGEVLGYRITEGMIRSRARLNYAQVQAAIEGRMEEAGPAWEFREMLGLMDRLSKALMEKRHRRGAIDFDLPEPEVFLDEYGTPLEIRRRARLDSHKLIESFMLLANETVARYLSERDVPFLYRVHDRPDTEKLEEFARFARALGYRFRPDKAKDPKYLQDFLSEVEGRPEEPVVRELLLRSMKRAVYSPYNIGHFGLASDVYTHFTSPIRRYPDLLVHRVLKEVLRGTLDDEKKGKLAESLQDMGAHLSDREWIADEAERASVDVKRVAFMKERLGERFWGIISSVRPFGFFVELEDFYVEGLVHVESLVDDYYYFDERNYCLRGERKGRRFSVGERVYIQVVRADEFLRQVDFKLVEDARPRRRTKRERRR